TSLFLAIPASAQVEAPPLDYVAVPDEFLLPPGMNMGSTSAVAINSKGNIFVLARGPDPLMEFDPSGKFVRAFGHGLFDRPHGLRIDADDNIWATDVATHVVYKLNPDGRILGAEVRQQGAVSSTSASAAAPRCRPSPLRACGLSGD